MKEQATIHPILVNYNRTISQSNQILCLGCYQPIPRAPRVKKRFETKKGTSL